jgi:hypothetical protein
MSGVSRIGDPHIGRERVVNLSGGNSNHIDFISKPNNNSIIKFNVDDATLSDSIAVPESNMLG